MARLNGDMQRAAVDELAPRPDDAVLAVGFGPGVGIAELVARLPDGSVAGADPSAARARGRAGAPGATVRRWRGSGSAHAGQSAEHPGARRHIRRRGRG
jgi:hypothetical protein